MFFCRLTIQFARLAKKTNIILQRRWLIPIYGKLLFSTFNQIVILLGKRCTENKFLHHDECCFSQNDMTTMHWFHETDGPALLRPKTNGTTLMVSEMALFLVWMPNLTWCACIKHLSNEKILNLSQNLQGFCENIDESSKMDFSIGVLLCIVKFESLFRKISSVGKGRYWNNEDMRAHGDLFAANKKIEVTVDSNS